MRPADIYRLHYESAFTRLNPGKPLVLPPSGFGNRVLPAPGSAPSPDIAAAVRPATGTSATVASAPPASDATHFDRVHPQPTAAMPMMASGLHEGYEADQRLRSAVDRERHAPIEDAVSVEAHDVSRGAKATDEQLSTTTVPLKSITPALMRRIHFDRQMILLAGALALGIGGTSLFFAHPDPHAIALAWHAYKVAMAAPSNRGAVAPRAIVGNTSPASGTSAPNANPATQQNAAIQIGTPGSTASNPIGITIPRAPAAAPRALTSQDLMPAPQGSSPLANVSPDALRRTTDLSVRTVTADPTTTAPANVYESPIRKPLKALHHQAEPNSGAEPVQGHPAHASEEADRKKNVRPTAAATPAAGKAPAQSMQQALQNTNGDQKIF